MKRKSEIKAIKIPIIITICMLEVLYFGWFSYNKNLFSLGVDFTINLFSNIIYFMIYLFVYYLCIVIFLDSKNYYYEKKSVLKGFIWILAVRIVCDFLKNVLLIAFIQYAVPLCNIIEVLFVISMYLIINKFILKYKFKDYIVNRKKKYICIMTASLLVALNISYFIWYNYSFEFTLRFYEKYNLSFEEIQNLSVTQAFHSQIYSMLLIIFISLALYMCYINCVPVKSKKVKRERNKIKRAIQVVTQCSFIVFVVLLAVLIKSIILPYGALVDFNGSTSAARNDSFGYKYFKIFINRGVDYSNTRVDYEKEYITLTYDSEKILRFDTPVPMSREFLDQEEALPDVSMVMKSPMVDLETPGIEASTFFDMALIYKESEKVKAIENKDIPNMKESDVLIKSLKELINLGYWEYFEYGYEYLSKYEKGFTDSYTKRYANGDFTDYERKINSHIREEYIIDFAQSKLQEIY